MLKGDICFGQIFSTMGKSKHATLSQKKKNQERLKSTELITADEMQVYGLVTRSLGDKRFECACSDGKTRICKIRGKFRGRLFVNLHEILLISLREEEDDKADIIHKYSPDEIHELKKMGEFKESDFNTENDGPEASPTPGGDEPVIVWTNGDIEKV